LIEDQDRAGGGVALGSRITLEDLRSGDRIDFRLVGPDETNPRDGKISHLSPVGRAVMGKTQGDEVEVATPGGKARYRLMSVE
jgi:transcription elongation factor GreA